MFNQYPYINLNDLNLDYILKAIKEMRYEVTNFVSINAIKYANPIQWNITSQYEKNTIVIDPLTGTAYISVAPVPAGVALTREEFWTVVFDLGSFVTRAAMNFTNRIESDTTLTATFPSDVGNWLIWGDVLYRVISPIVSGDQYVVDSNIVHFTMSDEFRNTLTFIENVMDNIADNFEDATTAPTDVDINNLIWWNDALFYTTAYVSTGDVLVEGTNVIRIKLNDFMNGNFKRLFNNIAVDFGTSATATQALTKNTLCWHFGQLYYSLAPINVGDTLTVGVNISQTIISDYLAGNFARIENVIDSLIRNIANNYNDAATAPNAISNNTLFWLNGNLYYSLTAINAGDAFTEGVNMAQINLADYLIGNFTRIESYTDTVFNNAIAYTDNTFNKVIPNARKFNTRKVLFVGDSNGVPSVIGATCYPTFVAAFLGFAEYHNLCVSGASFVDGSHSQTFLYQLESYAGDKSEITDIFIIDGLNNCRATNASDPYVATLNSAIDDFDTYARANYPNAAIYYGFVGNMRDSARLLVDPTDPRIYPARKFTMLSISEKVTALGWYYLPNTATTLCISDDLISNDHIHPTAGGEFTIGMCVARAIADYDAQVYAYDISCLTADNYPITRGHAMYTLYNRIAQLSFKGILQIDTKNVTLNERTYSLFKFSRLWFNEPVSVSSFIRLYNTQIGDVIMPCTYTFTENKVDVYFRGIFNDGTGETYVTAFNMGPAGFVEVPDMTITFDATVLT